MYNLAGSDISLSIGLNLLKSDNLVHKNKSGYPLALFMLLNFYKIIINGNR